MHLDSPLAYAVSHFFLNGGASAWVVRVAEGAVPAAIGMRTTAGDLTLTATAASEGAWGNALVLNVDYDSADPDESFKFRVKRDGRHVAGISKVGPLKRTTEVVEHRVGGDPSTSRKSPGRSRFEAITLERGVTHDPEFETWANLVWNVEAGLGAEVALKDFRKDIIIEMYNEAASWRWPTTSIAAGGPSSRPCPSLTPMPTPSRPSRSSWRTRAGCATARWRNRKNRGANGRLAREGLERCGQD
ncbi:phage tail protein [Rhodovulum sp.]|uniref:phage tail protein n=1 Tax=Rhodovulum sp. TaxID=34009 RepID=UPI0032E504FF